MKPPKYVTPPFDVPTEFTKGKKYEVLNFTETNDEYAGSFYVRNDFNKLCYSLLKICSQIDECDWIIVE